MYATLPRTWPVREDEQLQCQQQEQASSRPCAQRRLPPRGAQQLASS